MAVPFIDIKRFEDGFLDKWQTIINQMSANAQFIGGDSINTLEKKLSTNCGKTSVVTCANGTDALQLSLRALGVGNGDKVLLPDLTFWATYEAIINVGAQPILIDCNREDLTIDVNKLEQAINEFQPKAVMIVHLYGWVATKIIDIRKLCQNKNIALLEDSAQAFGTYVNDNSIFKGVQCATTSFYPAKVLGGAGDGGAVFCSDSKLADMVRQLSNHGRSTHYGYSAVGWNSRMDSLQAAFINLSLTHLPARLASRRKYAKKYRQALSGITGLSVVNAPDNCKENGYCNVILIDDLDIKNKLECKLKEAKIGFGNIYPSPMSAQAGAQPYLDESATKYCGENAKWVCSQIINLPLFAYMKDSEFNEIISVVKSVF